jgi:ligand-binding SRPBCC domain-containing protein
MTTFSRSIDIAAAPERVWAVMSDLDRWHEWTPSIRGITRQGGAPFATGTRVVIRQPKFPPAQWTITNVQPGRSFTWVSRAPGMQVTGTHAITATEGGSRVTLSLHYEGAVGRWLARLTRGITERYVGYEAEGLRARSEATGRGAE